MPASVARYLAYVAHAPCTLNRMNAFVRDGAVGRRKKVHSEITSRKRKESSLTSEETSKCRKSSSKRNESSLRRKESSTSKERSNSKETSSKSTQTPLDFERFGDAVKSDASQWNPVSVFIV